METILNICLTIFVIADVIALIGLSQNDERSTKIGAISGVVAIVSAIVVFIVGFIMKENKPEPHKYFPESEYSLEYIVTECGGEIDTTYVLTPKEK